MSRAKKRPHTMIAGLGADLTQAVNNHLRVTKEGLAGVDGEIKLRNFAHEAYRTSRLNNSVLKKNCLSDRIR